MIRYIFCIIPAAALQDLYRLRRIITAIGSVGRIFVSRFWGSYADKNSFAKMDMLCFGVAAVSFLFIVFSSGKFVSSAIVFEYYSFNTQNYIKKTRAEKQVLLFFRSLAFSVDNCEYRFNILTSAAIGQNVN